MNKLLAGVAALPFLATAAVAAQPLSDHQMDAVTAGFSAFATAGAEAEGGKSTAQQPPWPKLPSMRPMPFQIRKAAPQKQPYT